MKILVKNVLTSFALLSCASIQCSERTIQQANQRVQPQTALPLTHLVFQKLINMIDNELLVADAKATFEQFNESLQRNYFSKMPHDMVEKFKDMYVALKTNNAPWKAGETGRNSNIRLGLSDCRTVVLACDGSKLYIDALDGRRTKLVEREKRRQMNGNMWELKPGFLLTECGIVSHRRCLQLWNIAENKCITIDEGPRGWLSATCMISSFQFATYANQATEIKIWDIDSGICVKTMPCKKNIGILLSIGDNILIAVSPNAIQKWNLVTNELIEEIPGHFINIPYEYHELIDNDRFASDVFGVSVFNIHTGKLLYECTLSGLLSERRDVCSSCVGIRSLKNGTFAVLTNRAELHIFKNDTGERLQYIHAGYGISGPDNLLMLNDHTLSYSCRSRCGEGRFIRQTFQSVLKDHFEATLSKRQAEAHAKAKAALYAALDQPTCLICRDSYDCENNLCMCLPCCKQKICKTCVSAIFNTGITISNQFEGSTLSEQIPVRCPFCRRPGDEIRQLGGIKELGQP